MPKFMRVTTKEMLIDIAVDFYFMKDMPMFMPRDAPIREIVASHAYNFRAARWSDGNPIFSHFISSGYGAFVMITLVTGN